ncbi:MAG: hypothetical protein ACOCVX_05740 [Bacteroidales bacterium]
MKKFIWDYLLFCAEHRDVDFVLAMDGDDADYKRFCADYNIPLVYSEKREGVGLSKNRVLKTFPDYAYYFFIEDDVELIDARVFQLHIDAYKAFNIHHFAIADYNNPVNVNNVSAGEALITAQYAGAQFNFFTNEGLKQAGGWHTYFAKYKRYGHTEHTYRFYKLNLTPAPFCILRAARGMVIIHDPPHVSEVKGKLEKNSLVTEENEMVNEGFRYIPVETLSAFYFNAQVWPPKYSDQYKMKKYPFLNGKERRISLAEHYFLRIKTTSAWVRKLQYFIKSVMYYPFNNPLKHYIKTKLRRHAK